MSRIGYVLNVEAEDRPRAEFVPQGKSSKFSPHAQKVGLNHVVSAGEE